MALKHHLLEHLNNISQSESIQKSSPHISKPVSKYNGGDTSYTSYETQDQLCSHNISAVIFPHFL